MTDGNAPAPLERWQGAPVTDWRRRWDLPELTVYGRAGSTNDLARLRAEDGAPHGTTIIADEQTAGRGRRNRRWHAPPGRALLLSMVLRPRLQDGDEAWAGTLPLRAGLAAARAIERVAPVHTRIKWPNDVLIGPGKVAGVLCEGSLSGRDAFLIVGVGINVLLEPADFPAGLERPATSLLTETGRRINRAALAGALVGELRRSIEPAVGPLAGADAAELAARDALLGRALVDGQGNALGDAAGVDADGALLVRGPTGALSRLTDATVRPAPTTRSRSRLPEEDP